MDAEIKYEEKGNGNSEIKEENHHSNEMEQLCMLMIYMDTFVKRPRI